MKYEIFRNVAIFLCRCAAVPLCRCAAYFALSLHPAAATAATSTKFCHDPDTTALVLLEPTDMISCCSCMAFSSAFSRPLFSPVPSVPAAMLDFFPRGFLRPCCRATCPNHPAWLKGSMGRSVSRGLAARVVGC